MHWSGSNVYFACSPPLTSDAIAMNIEHFEHWAHIEIRTSTSKYSSFNGSNNFGSNKLFQFNAWNLEHEHEYAHCATWIKNIHDPALLWNSQLYGFFFPDFRFRNKQYANERWLKFQWAGRSLIRAFLFFFIFGSKCEIKRENSFCQMTRFVFYGFLDLELCLLLISYGDSELCF